MLVTENRSELLLGLTRIELAPSFRRLYHYGICHSMVQVCRNTIPNDTVYRKSVNENL